jgi:hypothetical protein
VTPWATTKCPDTVWAVCDEVVIGESGGFSMHHTLGLAHVPDPADDGFVVEPERLRLFEGMVFPESMLKKRGWEMLGEWKTIITKVRPPVETRIVGVILPHRYSVRVRRIADDSPSGEADAEVAAED